jgi:predicted transcriptional regulator
MSNIFSIRMDEEVKQMLDAFAKKSKIGKSEIINKALRHYIYLQEVENVSKELRPYAEAQGFHTEDDLFDSIS